MRSLRCSGSRSNSLNTNLALHAVSCDSKMLALASSMTKSYNPLNSSQADASLFITRKQRSCAVVDSDAPHNILHGFSRLAEEEHDTYSQKFDELDVELLLNQERGSIYRGDDGRRKNRRRSPGKSSSFLN